MIEIDGVSMSFGDVAVLEDVTTSISEGALVGLVGPNGAGKTTLLRTISGVLEPDRGTVTVDGRDVRELSSRASSRLVSVVPQDTTLSFSFDVRDVVEMGRMPHRRRLETPTREDRELVVRALERTRTAEFADRSIDEVSGGERQRVLLARAIAQDTPVTLLDEPTASLDVNHQVETLELVSRLVAEGRTVVAAIHDLDLAARYCDELRLLAGGNVIEAGPPEAVLTSETVERAFDARATVTTNPITGTPTVTALAPRSAPDDTPDRVHVVGGGSTAARALATLEAVGIEASIGPLPSGDVAAEAADDLGCERIEIEPFAPVDDGALEELLRRLEEASVAVLADLEVGAGNQRVLEHLAECSRLVVLERRPFSERNAAGEAAQRRYADLRRRSRAATLETLVDAVCEEAATDEGDAQTSGSPPAGTDSLDVEPTDD